MDRIIKIAKHKSGEKLLKYQKNHQISLFFFLQQVMKKFFEFRENENMLKQLENYQNELEKEEQKKRVSANVVIQRLDEDWDMMGLNPAQKKDKLVSQIKQVV